MLLPSPQHTVLTPATLDSFASGFIASLSDKGDETRGTYRRTLREFLRWVKQRGEFIVSIHEVELYRDYLRSTKRMTSVSTYLTALRRFCDYLVAQGIMADNPGIHVRGGKRPSHHSRQTISSNDIEKLLEVIPSTGELALRDTAMIHLMLSCALSEVELVRANLEDLDTSSGGMHLRVQGKGRDRKDATVELPPSAQRVLQRYLTLRTGAPPSEPLFRSAGPRTRGMRMTTRGIRSRVSSYLTLAGIGQARQVTPYSLRHTAARRLAEAGATPSEIKEHLRLGSIATAKLYLKPRSGKPTLR